MKLICAPKEKKLLGTKEVGGKEEACLIDRPPIFLHGFQQWKSLIEASKS
jgi:hypothetical protein